MICKKCANEYDESLGACPVCKTVNKNEKKNFKLTIDSEKPFLYAICVKHDLPCCIIEGERQKQKCWDCQKHKNNSNFKLRCCNHINHCCQHRQKQQAKRS